MSDDFTPGLREELVTDALLTRIEHAREQGWLVEWKDIDDDAISEILARHIHNQFLNWVGQVPQSASDRTRVQVDMANRLLELLSADIGRFPAIENDPRLLMEVQRPGGSY